MPCMTTRPMCRPRCTIAGPRPTPCAASSSGCASTPSLSDDELGAMEQTRRGSDRRGRHARRGECLARSGHARGWRLRRLRRAAVSRRSRSPATARGSTTSCGSRAPRSCSPFPAQRIGSRERSRAGRRGARPDASLLRRFAGRRRPAQAAALSRDGQVRALRCALVGRMIAMGGGFPVRRAVQDMEAYEAALRMLRDGDDAARLPGGHAQSRRQGAAAVGRGAAGARGGSGPRARLDPR